MLSKASVLDLKYPPSDPPGLQGVAAILVPDRLRSCVRPCVAADLRRRPKSGFARIGPKHVWSYHGNQAKRVRQSGEWLAPAPGDPASCEKVMRRGRCLALRIAV